MHTSINRLMLGFASLAVSMFGAVGAASAAATTVNLTAQRNVNAVMPDGAAVPMWGYCGALDAANSNAGITVGGATCGGPWTPGPTIVVPVGDSLTINLTNKLPVATSVTILGQLGGGLGTPARDTSKVPHPPVSGTSWPVTGGGAAFTPPDQPVLRANSFGSATPAGGKQAYTWQNLKPGTYLYETGTRPSIQAPMGLYGVLIVTNSPTTTGTPPTAVAAGTAFLSGAVNGVAVPALSYDSDAAMLISEVDAAQNTAVDKAVQTAGFSETTKWTPTCAPGCYPPAVNYAPTYLLLNGQPFDRNNSGANAALPQALGVPSGTLHSTGNMMLRVVNAGLRTHVPSLVGLPMQQIAEDGNRAPGTPQTVSELLMTAGKTRDVLIRPTTNASGTAAATAYTPAAYGFFDRALGLSSNGSPNGGAQGYLAIVDAATVAPKTGQTASQALSAWLGTSAGKAAVVTAAAKADSFTIPGTFKTYANNVLTNDVGIYSAAVTQQPAAGSLTMTANGSFVYTASAPPSTPPAAGTAIDSFMYCGNGATSGALCATVSLVAGGGGSSTVSAKADTYTSSVATLFRAWAGEGVLANDVDSRGFPLTASLSGSSNCATLNPDGSFVATSGGGGSCTFNYIATDSQGAQSGVTAVTVNFLVGSGLAVTVQDALGIQQNAGQGSTASSTLTDYMWVIEEDPTIHTVPGVTPASQNGNPALTISNSFHISHTPIVAAGCTGPLSCGDAQSLGGTGVATPPRSSPKDVHLDTAKHYFISVLPGDAGNAFIAGLAGDPTIAGNCTFSNTTTPNVDSSGSPTDCGHTIGGAMVNAGQTAVTVLVDPNPLKPSQLSIIAFEDNNPINGDLDDGETGLGGFNIVIFDAAGRSGDPAGQITYDAFNMPLTNWLLGKPGCPNEENPTVQSDKNLSNPAAGGANSLVGTIYTCPDGHRNIAGITAVRNRGATSIVVTTATPHQFTPGTAVDFSGIGNALFNTTFTVTNCRQSNATTFCVAAPPGFTNAAVTVGKGASVRDPAIYSLAGHALVKNIMPGRFDVLMHPSAAREGDRETWYQVSTLEGTPANDAFARAGEPAYFQEFGPPGYHAFVGWMNPDRIQTINQLVGQGNTVKGRVTNLHMSRPSAIFNYDSTTRDPLKNSVCYVGLNTTGGNGATAAFARCNDDGSYTLTNVPFGSHQVVVWDQWLDQIIAYFNVNVTADPAAPNRPVTVDLKDTPVLSWFTMVQENAFVYDDASCPTNAIAAAGGSQSVLNNPNGALKACATTPLAQIPITVRFRDGSISNVLLTDSNGNATFNELFPLFNWYVAEVDQTRYSPLTAHVVVDGGGKPDCTTANADGTSAPNYTAGCTTGGLVQGAVTSKYPTGESTETTYAAGELYFGLQGFISQTEKIDWGKTVLPSGQNGGFSGLVVYTSTRGFDDPSLEVQFMWEPLVPRVPVNLYQKVTGADGSSALKMVAKTTTTSWDDVAAGTYSDPVRNPLGIGKPSCPGQTPDAQDPYVHQVLGSDTTRCYDGFHNWNQVQPETYDGYYQFAGIYPGGYAPDANGVLQPVGTFSPAIPDGQYVIEIVPPAGYEIVKEEDKNILIGDAWVAPAAQQFAALGNIFILPDQATIASAYNLNGPSSLQSRLGFVAGKTQFPLCAGSAHLVPDYLSLFPQSGQVAPFAGAYRPLCDRKEVSIVAGQNGGANFFLFSNTPRASKFTGIILDDASAEFNVAAPDFGEKFGVPYVAVSIKDQYGVEIERVYGDQWGGYNGMTPSTWQVNVPNPAGYSPNMLVTCMNDPGPITVGGITQIDPQYMPSYSNFCYTNPFMPGLTTYLDTPVLPVGAFASNYVSGYNPVDCAYPDTTPAISRVDGDGTGPWLSASGAGHILKIKSLGTVQVPNAAYLGPNQDGTTINGQKTVSRTYNFAGGQGKVFLSGQEITSGVIWGSDEIDVTVPGTFAPGSYELGITNTNGKSSVDTVTVTIEAKKPLVLSAPSNSVTTGGASHVVQAAIDAANPGDLIILDAGVYNELVVMWKPVRLQGVAAASVIINAAKYPTDKLEAWRPTINNLFGVDTISGNASANPQVDPLPGQEITGGIVFLEPSVLATEEGAGITVLAKSRANGPNEGACNSAAVSDYYDSTKVHTVRGVQQGTIVKSNRRISDSYFDCPNRPSRIDGISVTGGDAGGGIYVNGYAHGLEIANNRVYGNAGAFGGGIRVGIPHLETQDLRTIQDGFDNNVNIHHNSITQNGLIEASGAVGGTPGASGAGAGLAICTGTNNYKANYNFVCGNYSSSDGGGIGHIGYSSNGTIANNTIIFNQSFFQQSATNGGGIAIEGDAAAAGGLTLGSGPGLTVDSNFVQGNFAQGGHGGGIALMQVNGSDTSCNNGKCSYGNKVTLTNNMIVDNVAGWSAGGLYLQDAFNVNVVNNTLAMNDSVGIAGPLFNGGNNGKPNPAGIAADATSPALQSLGGGVPTYSYPASLENNIVWHNRSFYGSLSGTLSPPNNVGLQGTAGTYYSNATLCSSNDTANTPSAPNCTKLATALSSTTTALQTLASGQCDAANERYWDLGRVGDASAAVPGANGLKPQSSLLTSTTGYPGNKTGDPLFSKQYCNSSQAISASSDEQGNFVDFRYGPLSQTAPVAYTGTAAGALFGNYILSGTTSPAYDSGVSTGPVPTHDFVGTTRPQGATYDIGAFELVAAAGKADLAVSITDGRATVFRGDSLTYSIVVTNNGPGSVPGAVLSDARPAGISQGSWSWSCAPAGANGCGTTGNNGTGNINKTLGTLASGASVTITASGRVSNTATAGSLVNTATVTAPVGVDANTANNAAMDTDTVVVGTGSVAFTSSTKGTLRTIGGNRTLGFGGSAGGSAVTLTISGAPVTFGPTTVTNLLGSAFALTTDGCTGKTVPATGANTCTVTITYAGGFGGGTMVVSDSAPSNPQTLALSGF